MQCCRDDRSPLGALALSQNQARSTDIPTVGPGYEEDKLGTTLSTVISNRPGSRCRDNSGFSVKLPSGPSLSSSVLCSSWAHCPWLPWAICQASSGILPRCWAQFAVSLVGSTWSRVISSSPNCDERAEISPRGLIPKHARSSNVRPPRIVARRCVAKLALCALTLFAYMVNFTNPWATHPCHQAFGCAFTYNMVK